MVVYKGMLMSLYFARKDPTESSLPTCLLNSMFQIMLTRLSLALIRVHSSECLILKTNWHLLNGACTQVHKLLFPLRLISFSQFKSMTITCYQVPAGNYWNPRKMWMGFTKEKKIIYVQCTLHTCASRYFLQTKIIRYENRGSASFLFYIAPDQVNGWMLPFQFCSTPQVSCISHGAYLQWPVANEKHK